MNESLQQLRREYKNAQLDLSLTEDPIGQFTLWLNQAIAAEVPDPTAMVLATVSTEGIPSVRVVLLKGIENHQFIFYTDYNSHKGLEISHNPNVALNFYWPLVERQVIIQGQAQRLNAALADQYFQERPRESQIAAWASKQSQPIDSRESLLARQQTFREQFKDKTVPRPENWGGFAVTPYYIEFWQGRENRLHDRIGYNRNEPVWEMERLSP